MVMDWPTASVILGTMATVAGAVAKFAPTTKSGNGSNGGEHGVCIHGDKIAILLTKFEAMDKKLDEFIIVNKDTNDEQYEKINQNTQHLAEMNGILKIVQRKVLNGSGE